jgi:voltage-gated potassium channel
MTSQLSRSLKADVYLSKYYKRVSYTFFLIVASTTFGTVGFMLIEGYTFIEAFYMTIITMSTVGFNEVQHLSDPGRLFTSVLIVSNIGIFFYGVTTIGGFIVEGEFKNLFQTFKIYKKIDKLSGHTIVCGYGRNGKQVCEELLSHNSKFVVIDNKKELIDQIRENESILYIDGDATDDDVLVRAGIDNAKFIITTLPADPNNVYVVLSAKELNPDIIIISRASNEDSVSKLKSAGAKYVIMPEKIGGSHMATLVTEPDIMEFLSLLTGQESEFNISFEEFSLENLKEDQITIKQLEIRKKTGANVIGIKNEKGEYIVNPLIDDKLTSKTKLVILGSNEQIKKTRDLISGL